MKGWMKAGIVAGVGIAGTVAAGQLGMRRWNRATNDVVERLINSGAHATTDARTFRLGQLEGLPDVVKRYFEYAIPEGHPIAPRWQVRQSGFFRIGGPDSPWLPLSAVQDFSLEPRGFVWDARIRMAPLVDVRVRDSFIEGTGGMQARMAGLIGLVNQVGSPELASGALQRYLAEAVWCPTALLPGNGLEWEGIDANSARATLTANGTTVSLDFCFGDHGEIVQAFTFSRFRDVHGVSVPTPWICTNSEWTRLAGMMVPRIGEVAWKPADRELPYCRLEILDMVPATVARRVS